MENLNIGYDKILDNKHLIHFKEGGLLNFLVAKPIVPDYPYLQKKMRKIVLYETAKSNLF